jgi:protein-tyrosine-phosphatase
VTTQGSRKGRMNFSKMILCVCITFSSSAWGTVLVKWSEPAPPPASSLGVNDIVYASNIPPAVLESARKQGYRVYVETPLKESKAASEQCAKAGCAGIILSVSESERADVDQSVNSLRSAYPKLRFLVLIRDGKQPQIRGSLVIKRDSVLEVSSPTMQPWIDTNLALVKVEQRSHPQQVPFYSFSWANAGQHRTQTADDYLLAVAEAGAFHADLLLQVDEDLQRALIKRDGEAWALWDQVRSVLKFSNSPTEKALKPAANVAVVVDKLDASDEVLNLLSRHNIPFQMFLAADLKTVELQRFDIVIVFAKPDAESGERISTLASGGRTVVVVDAHGKYPWQGSQPVQLNEHTTSYAVGKGKVLELAEPVGDPETFAQDIRRLLGKSNALLSLWNGLTTVAVPYKDGGGTVKQLEFVNYAGDPLRVQVQLKGMFTNIRYETPEHGCCQSLEPVRHNGFTEFVIPELRITGRVHLETH